MDLRDVFLAPSFSFSDGGKRCVMRGLFVLASTTTLFLGMHLVLFELRWLYPILSDLGALIFFYLLPLVFTYLAARWIIHRLRFSRLHARKAGIGATLVALGVGMLWLAYSAGLGLLFPSGMLVFGLYLFCRYFSEGPELVLVGNVQSIGRKRQ